MKILKKIKRNLEVKKVVKLINEEKVVALPTETVYGLFIKAKPGNDKVLNNLKERDANKFVAVFFPSRNEAYKYVTLTPYQESITDAEYPGNKTIIVNINEKGKKLIGKNYDSIGLRIPSIYDSKYLLKILQKTGPLFATSVNLHGQEPLNNPKEIKKVFKGKVSAVVSYKIKNPRPSTVLDLTTDDIKVLRK